MCRRSVAFARDTRFDEEIGVNEIKTARPLASRFFRIISITLQPCVLCVCVAIHSQNTIYHISRTKKPLFMSLF